MARREKERFRSPMQMSRGIQVQETGRYRYGMKMAEVAGGRGAGGKRVRSKDKEGGVAEVRNFRLAVPGGERAGGGRRVGREGANQASAAAGVPAVSGLLGLVKAQAGLARRKSRNGPRKTGEMTSRLPVGKGQAVGRN